MSEESEKIQNLVSQMRKLCTQISLLLRTGDSLMGEADWSPATGNSITSGNSTNLHSPRQWIPQYLYRFYQNSENYPHLQTFLSVILDDRDNNDPNITINGPLLTAGCFDWGKGNEIKQVHNWHCVFHCWLPARADSGPKERQDDGSIVHFNLKGDPDFSSFIDRHELPYERVSTMGLPLVDISDSESLKNKLISPLLSGIEQAEQ
jgi:hypothetical protein